MSSPPDIQITSARRSIMERLSIVWLIPVTTLLIALGVAWQSYSDRGPLIQISFESASGIKAGETVLRYRDVNVGIVEEVGFSPLLQEVYVSVRLDKTIAPFVDDDAEFWVVRPVVTAQGVSGLGTVLSGVFIEGLWDKTPSGLVTNHVGLANAPLLKVGETGLQVVMRAQGSAVLSEGTPILFKGIKVGQLGRPRLGGNGAEAVADAIIYAPHDQLISSSTRFWDISGFSFKIGSGGAELGFSSLASLISGGITFENILSGGERISDGAQFDIYPDEAAARASIFSDSSGPTLELAVVFDENVSGLSAGSFVEYTGVRIGEVTSLRGIYDEAQFGDSRVRLLVSMEIRPERLGLAEGTTPAAALAFITDRVAEGLRARLATSSILTGGLKVELVQVDDAPPAAVVVPAEGMPILPSTANNIQDVAATAQGVLQRLNDLPIEELLGSAIVFLDNASELVASSDVQSVPGEIVGLIADARGVIGSDDVQKLPANLNALLAELQGTTGDLRRILDQIEQADTVSRLLAAIDAASTASKDVGEAFTGVPELMDQLSALTRTASALPLEKLVTDITAIVNTANDLLASEGAKALPEVLASALAEVDAVLAELRAGGVVENANRTFASTADAADAVAAATEDLPALVARIEALIDQASTTLADFSGSSEINRDVRSALREIQAAASAVTSLSRALERRPNSLILGR
ncbi:MlaD family protein [Phaeovulum sp.]|uniref:MlaD family protein n=1 Tax=Phaeovulum sp. TaxID=2934796 RepID=UPI0035694AAB